MNEYDLQEDQFQFRMKMVRPTVNADKLLKPSEIVSSLSLKSFKQLIEKIEPLNECSDQMMLKNISTLGLKVYDVHRITVHCRPHIETKGTKSCTCRMLAVITEVKIMSDNYKMIQSLQKDFM